MLSTPMDILKAFPVRKRKAQKQAFLDAVAVYGKFLDYPVTVEQNNLILGEPMDSSYLVTVSYAEKDSGVIALLELAATLQKKERHGVAFVLMDHAGAYFRNHRQETRHQLMLNLDDISKGNQLSLIPTKRLKGDRKKLTSLYKACGYFGPKSILVDEKAKLPIFSWVNRWPYGVCIRTRQEEKRKPQEGMDLTNINLLRASLATFLTQREG